MLAYWLARAGVSVELWESRPVFSRKQILYMSSEFWDAVPDAVKAELGADGACHYDDNPMLCSPQKRGRYVNLLISSFQRHMLDYLTGADDVASRVHLVSGSPARLAELLRPPQSVLIVADGGGRDSLVHDLWSRTAPFPKRSVIDGSWPPGSHPFDAIHVAHAAVVTFDAGVDEEVARRRDTEQLVWVQEPKQRAALSFRTLPESAYIGVQLSDATAARLHQSRGADDDGGGAMAAFLDTAEGELYADLLTRSGYRDVRNESLSVFPVHLRSAKRFYYTLRPDDSDDAQTGSPVPTTHCFVIGDAAFTTHFFTGTGMNKGLEVGRVLLDLLLNQPESRWPSYSASVARVRDQLWDEVVPKILPDIARAVHMCRQEGTRGIDSGPTCLMKQSRLLDDDDAAARIRDRVFVQN